MRIRPATFEDLDALVEGNQRLALETEARHLDANTLRAGVSAVLSHAEYGRYWVAQEHQAVCGQLMITFEWSDWRNRPLWWLQSVYVWPSARRQGIFSALLAQVIAEAKQAGVPELRLYAECHNTVAHQAYARQGFTSGHYGVHCKILSEIN